MTDLAIKMVPEALPRAGNAAQGPGWSDPSNIQVGTTISWSIPVSQAIPK